MNFSFISEVFFPHQCLVCGARRENKPCCTLCFETMRIATGPLRAADIREDIPCEVGAATMYHTDAIKTLIYKVKFDGMRSAAAPLGDLLIAYAVSAFRADDFSSGVVIPIPLSKKRERLRGYNQAALIGKHFAERVGLRLLNDVLVRTRNTSPQSETVSAIDRQKNIVGCFAAIRPAPPRVIVVDDIITTGATMREAVLALRAAGAEKIIALAVARAPLRKNRERPPPTAAALS